MAVSDRANVFFCYFWKVIIVTHSLYELENKITTLVLGVLIIFLIILNFEYILLYFNSFIHKDEKWSDILRKSCGLSKLGLLTWRRNFPLIKSSRKTTLTFRKSCFNESPSKMMKNAFYFILKSFFILKIFNFLSWLFGHVEKPAWLKGYLKFMTSQPGLQIIAIHTAH